MPVCRIRQITAAINQRLKGRETMKRTYIEWQTKNLSQMIVSTAGELTDEGRQMLGKAITNMSLDPKKQAKNQAVELAEFDPEDDAAALERAAGGNRVGSYEHIMGGFAGPGAPQ